MIATLCFILWGSLQLAVLCSAVPLERRTAMQLPARFDAGLVNSCEIPAANFCSVDYSVPTSVARLTLVIVEEIRNRYEEDKAGKGLECAQALRDIRCAQRFPRCSADNTQVTLSSLNCAERMSVCSGNIQMMLQEEGFCTLNGTSLIGECRPVTEYGYQFRHCPMSSDSWHVTRWMYEVMRHADVKLAAQFNGSTLGSTNPECRRKYATYFCQFMGRCMSHEEPRVEVVNTYEMCEETVNCFPHWLANILKLAFPCSQWPSRHGPVSGPPPESSPSSPVMIDQTTEPPSGSSSDDSTLRTATTRPTWPNPTFTLDTNESGPPPESSPSSPVVINQTTEPPSGSSSDDSTLRTTTMRPTWPNPTFTLDTNEFAIGTASFHSVCTWTLLLLTVVAISGSL